MRITSTNEITERVNEYIGLEVSRAWKGHGSAIFLEIGEVKDGKRDLTLMIEWSWRVERGNKILFGSWSEPSELDSFIAALSGLKLIGITTQCRLPELSVQLSDSTWLNSFSTVEGDPEWAILLPKLSFQSKNGRIVSESTSGI